MSAVGVIKDLWLIQKEVGFVSIIKWHITVATVVRLCDVVAFKARQFNNPPKLNRNTNVDVR